MMDIFVPLITSFQSFSLFHLCRWLNGIEGRRTLSESLSWSKNSGQWKLSSYLEWKYICNKIINPFSRTFVQFVFMSDLKKLSWQPTTLSKWPYRHFSPIVRFEPQCLVLEVTSLFIKPHGTMSSCHHCITLPFHNAIMPPCHHATTVSSCHHVIMPPCHHANMSS